MTDILYYCTKHKLDIVCHECVRAKYRRYDKLLEFVKGIIDDWKCDPNHAVNLLSEIGEYHVRHSKRS